MEELGDVGHVEDVEVKQVIVNQLAKHRFSWRYHIISLLSTNKEEFHRGSSTNWSSTHFPEEIIWFLCCLGAKAGGSQLWHFLFSTDSIYFITCNNAPNDSLKILYFLLCFPNPESDFHYTATLQL